MRDGTPVGQLRASMFVPAGYVKLEGATVNRSNYPRLVALANKYSLWTTDTAANPGLFGKGNNSTTMVLPNWTGRMAQFASTAGGKVDAGLPNVSGNSYLGAAIPNGQLNSIGMQEYSGAITCTTPSINIAVFSSPVGGATHDSAAGFKIDASRSNSIYGNATTVQPASINTFAIMRY